MPNHVPLPLVPISELAIERYYIPAHLGCPNTSIHPERPLTIYRRPFNSTSASSSSHYSLPNPTSIESHLKHHGIVHPAWRYTMYKQDHFHSNTNEVLIVIAPSTPNRAGLIQFGGPEVDEVIGPEKETDLEATTSGDGETAPIYIKVRQGDVIMIPAGVSHALHSLIHDSNPDPKGHSIPDEHLREANEQPFAMIGAYPTSSDSWDMCYPTPSPDRPTNRPRSKEDKNEPDDGLQAEQRENVERVGWFERDPVYGLTGLV